MPPDGLIRYLHAATAPDAGVTDAELVRRCAARDDDTAFELLMRRHAAMVWNVCRSVTRDHHAAEDAFQATFLVLNRKAAAVRGSVPGWLYRVAMNAALKCRANRDREGVGSPNEYPLPCDRGSPDPLETTELVAALYEELDRLGEAYRLPLVLCYLEGYTQAEAAEALGWPVGTVATRVNRGRDRLRARLARRGFAAPAAGIPLLFSNPPASGLSPSFVAESVRAIGSNAVRPVVRSLAHGVASAMTQSNKLIAACAVAVVAAGAALTFGAKPDPTAPTAPPPPDPPTVPDKDGLRDALIVVHDVRAGTSRLLRVQGADQLATLEGFFPGYRKRPSSDTAAGWMLGYEVYFNFDLGNTVRVKVSSPLNDPAHWTVGRGDFDVKGDFHVFAANLLSADPSGSSGDWSRPVNGLKARLTLERGKELNGTPILTAFVELHNVSDSAHPIELPLGKLDFKWSVADAGGKAQPTTSGPGNEITLDPPPTLMVPYRGTLRMVVSRHIHGIRKDLAGHLDLGWDDHWVFGRGDGVAYTLRGTMTSAAKGDYEWTGTVDLPPVQIPLAGR